MHGGNAGEIDHANELAAFAEAILSRDSDTITYARNALIDVACHAAMTDAAGVASNFQHMVRIADSTGIILGDFDAPTAQMRQSLGIDKFNTHEYHLLTVLPRR